MVSAYGVCNYPDYPRDKLLDNFFKMERTSLPFVFIILKRMKNYFLCNQIRMFNKDMILSDFSQVSFFLFSQHTASYICML